MLIKRLTRLSILITVCALNACSIYSPPGTTPAPVEERSDYGSGTAPEVIAPEEEDVTDPGTIAAYGPLLEEAENAAARGDYEHALALLERAQRIDPDNPRIYLAIAETHDARGDYVQARAVAERGLLYCDEERYCESLRAYVP